MEIQVLVSERLHCHCRFWILNVLEENLSEIQGNNFNSGLFENSGFFYNNYIIFMIYWS